MNANRNVKSTYWNDPDDAPELNDAFFERADEYDGQRLVRRGIRADSQRYVAMNVSIDSDIVKSFSASGPGWQGRMNEILRDWLHKHPPV